MHNTSCKANVNVNKAKVARGGNTKKNNSEKIFFFPSLCFILFFYELLIKSQDYHCYQELYISNIHTCTIWNHFFRTDSVCEIYMQMDFI